MPDKTNNNLPPHWSWVKLSDICEIVMGQSPPSSTYNTKQIGLPFFQGKAEFTDLYPEVKKWCSAPNKIAEPLDILVSVRAPVGSTNIANQKCCIGRGLAALRYPDCNKYIFYYFHLIENKLDELGTRSTFKAISSKTLNSVEVPLPPLPEQKKIVEKIEELFSQLDFGVASLKKAKAQLLIYRQTVLKAAFSGRLTETFLDKNYDIFNRIDTLRKEDYKKTASNNKSKKFESSESFVLNEDLPKLPPNWIWTKIELSLSSKKHSIKAGPFGSSLKKEIYTKTGYKIYGQEQVIRSESNFGDYYVGEKKYKELINYSVKDGDILISLVGTIGKVLILPESAREGIINPRLVKITLNPKIMLAKYFKYYFESSFVKSIYNLKTHGATMDVLNLGIIKALPFPMCSINFQNLIVAEIEKRFSEADNLEKAINDSLAKSETLRQSILKKAFEGKLI